MPALPSAIRLGSTGLVLAPGELSTAPGALIQADNVNVEAPGVIRSRFGFAKTANGFGGPVWKCLSTKELAASLLMNYGSASVATGLKYGDGTGSAVAITGTFTNQPATRMQCAVSRRNHYLTTDEGVRRLETDFSPWFAGMPKGLPLDLTGASGVPVTVLSGAPGVVVNDGEAVAYRVVWCKKDQQGAVMRGSPAGRVVVYNNTRTTGWVTTVAKNVSCRIVLPKAALTASTALTTDYFYQLYRSRAEVSPIVPGDDMNLVAEAFLTSSDISAGYVDVADSTPELFRALGEPLYTNANVGGDDGAGGPGLSQSNDPPPRARDVSLFAECLVLSDLVYPCALDFTILSTVASTGLTAGDTLTIGGIVYTAVASGATPANNEFRVITVAGGSTASEAAERSAQNLIEAINRSTTNTTVWAYYASSPTTLPGQVHLESRVNATAFTALASAHGNAYRPQLGATVSAIGDTFANGFAFSKPAQGDAVPRVNLGFIGRDDTALLRQVVLRDGVYFFTDAGIYRLTGRDFASFSVQEFDLSFRLAGRELVVVCDDFIFAWGYEGIAKISSAGVEYISNAIEPLVWQTINTLGQTRLAGYAWATAYRSRHKVLFSIPAAATGSNAGNAVYTLVYDTRMQSWTRWVYKAGNDANRTQGHSCGAVRVSDDILFLGQWNAAAADAFVFKERRTYVASADFIDDTYDTTSQAITKVVAWAAAVGASDMETHWDALQLFFDVSPTFSTWTTPTALTVQFTADFASASASASLAPTAASRVSMAGVPQAQRRSARQTVTVTHSVASEYFGLEGLALIHLPPDGQHRVRT